MEKSFLQSDLWQKFQQALGRKTFQIDSIYIYKHNLPFGKSYLYAPRVSLPKDFNFKEFLKKIQEKAKKENSIFLRIEPQNNLEFKINNLKFTRAQPLQPQDTLTLDISKNEQELLAQMKQKTRYNIRLAQKHGLKAQISTDPKDIDIFWQLATETEKREKFHFHPKIYYQKMMEVLGKENKVWLLTICFQKTPLASGIILFSDKLAYSPKANKVLPKAGSYFLHGASSSKFRNLMPTYLLQWQAILEAKKRGCKIYDFWGVAPSSLSQVLPLKSSSHPWQGISRFKFGFAPNGKILHYPPAYIFVFQPFWWWLYKILKRL